MKKNIGLNNIIRILDTFSHKNHRTKGKCKNIKETETTLGFSHSCQGNCNVSLSQVCIHDLWYGVRENF